MTPAIDRGWRMLRGDERSSPNDSFFRKIEGDSDQASGIILSFLIGIKIVQFSAFVENYKGIETVNFDRDLWRILTYVSGDIKATQDFIRAVIAFHNGKNVGLSTRLCWLRF